MDFQEIIFSSRNPLSYFTNLCMDKNSFLNKILSKRNLESMHYLKESEHLEIFSKVKTKFDDESSLNSYKYKYWISLKQDFSSRNFRWLLIYFSQYSGLSTDYLHQELLMIEKEFEKNKLFKINK